MVSSPPPEFVAVILAGTTGARLFPLTTTGQETPGGGADVHLPKHLLPIGGIPAIVSLVKRVSEAGFESCIVAVAPSSVGPTRTALTSHFPPAEPQGNNKNSEPWLMLGPTKIEFVTLPSECAGSTQALRHVSTSLSPQSHVMVLACDVVLESPTILQRLANAHRRSFFYPEKDTCACTMLLCNVGDEDETTGVPLKESAKQKKGGLAREEEEIEYTGLAVVEGAHDDDNMSRRVLMKQYKVVVEEDEDMVGTTPKLMVPKRLETPLEIRTDLYDVHMYVLSPWVLHQLLPARPKLASIQKELLPLLISRQFRGIASAFGSRSLMEPANQDLLNQAIASLSSSPIQTSEQEEDDFGNSEVKLADKNRAFTVNATVMPRGTLAIRACTVPSYLHACREVVSRAISSSKNDDSNPVVLLPEGTTVQAKFNSIVLPEAVLGEKVTVKASAVGRRSKLGTKCRLNNVIVMDDVTVGENCVLQNSVLGTGSIVGDNCNLNDCQVGPGATVPSGTKEKGDSFMR
eukprot:scaffold15802_cov54-Attheya_sp.AAC.3